MSTADTVKSFGVVLALVGVASLSDLISAGLASLQISTVSALFAGPQALITIGVAAVLAAVDFLFGSDLLGYVAGTFAIFFSIQVLISLLTLCVFYAAFLISPKGMYTLSDYLWAAGVFLLESVPFLGTYLFWGTFTAYLRRKQISGVVGKFSDVFGLKEAGGVLGLLRNAFKKG